MYGPLQVLEMPPLAYLVCEIGKPLVAGGHPRKLRPSLWIVPRGNQRPDLLSELSIPRSLSRGISFHDLASVYVETEEIYRQVTGKQVWKQSSTRA